MLTRPARHEAKAKTEAMKSEAEDEAQIFFSRPRPQCMNNFVCKGKGKVFPYSLPSVGPGADRGVQAVSPQVK